MAVLTERRFFPEGDEWDVMGDWNHNRSVAFMIDTCSLPISIELLRIGSSNDIDGDDEKLSLPNLANPRFNLDKEGCGALLHGIMLAVSCAANHHKRFPSARKQWAEQG
jgi:hypothetical protein